MMIHILAWKRPQPRQSLMEMLEEEAKERDISVLSMLEKLKERRIGTLKNAKPCRKMDELKGKEKNTPTAARESIRKR